MERKLIRFGKSAFCITLPIDWVRKHELAKGDVLNIGETTNNSLEVLPTAEAVTDTTRSVTIDLSEMPAEEVAHVLRAAYVNGYFVIHLNGVNEQTSEAVHRQVQDFVAAEIMECTDSQMKIQVFWDIKRINLQSILQRIRFLVQDLFSDTVSCLDQEVPFSQLEDNGRILQRQVLLARRATTYALLNSAAAQQFNTSSIGLHYISFMMNFLGRIGEHLVGFSKIISVSGEELSDEQKNELASLVKSAEHYLRKLLDAYSSKKKHAFFVAGALSEFEQAIMDFRQTHGKQWAPLILSEYIRLILSNIKDTEFMIISMDNAPDSQKAVA